MSDLYDTILIFFDKKIVQDILTGIYASVVFLFIISRLKPQIRICDNIAFQYKHNGGEQKYNYSFKIINKSYLFQIYDINVRVYNSKKEPSINSEDIKYEIVSLKKDRVWHVNRLNLKHSFQDFFCGDRRLKGRTDYAVQFVTNDNLRTMIKHGKCIKFELIAKHSLTGFTRVVSKEFKHESEIIKGEYFSGNTCRINKI